MADLYRSPGLAIYEAAHYSKGAHIGEVEALFSLVRRPDARVLDLGCGGGLHALLFAEPGLNVTGVDLEKSAIDLAKRRASKRGLSAVFEVLDLADPALGGLGEFDLIYSVGNVLSHLPKALLPAVLRRLGTMLSPGGVLVFDLFLSDETLPARKSEPNANISWERELLSPDGLIRLTGTFADYDVTEEFSVWGYEPAEVAGMLGEAGLMLLETSQNLAFEPARDKATAYCLKFRAIRADPLPFHP